MARRLYALLGLVWILTGIFIFFIPRWYSVIAGASYPQDFRHYRYDVPTFGTDAIGNSSYRIDSERTIAELLLWLFIGAFTGFLMWQRRRRARGQEVELER
jgi:hypothetical protein